MMQSAESPTPRSFRTRTAVAALGAVAPIVVLSAEAVLAQTPDQLDYLIFGICLVSLRGLDIEVSDLKAMLPGKSKSA